MYSIDMKIDKSHFNEFDVEQKINELRENPKFDLEYRQIDALYRLINTFTTLRKELGVTQEELAKRCYISQQAISRIEKEKHVPNLDTFLKMLTALNIEIRLESKSSN